MRMLIKENKLYDMIYNFIDGEINFEDLNWSSPIVYDPQDDSLFGEEDGIIEYYYGDYDSDIGEFLFDYFSPEYYDDSPGGKPFKEKSPILEIRDENFHSALLNLFGDDLWRKPLKEWFENKFNLPVNTITHHYQ
tara:strand:- start:534 stop:938 length:405 start_codon:yes stop_codon:yes gene_type:complete